MPRPYMGLITPDDYTRWGGDIQSGTGHEGGAPLKWPFSSAHLLSQPS
jgi:hypothetical protein